MQQKVGADEWAHIWAFQCEEGRLEGMAALYKDMAFDVLMAGRTRSAFSIQHAGTAADAYIGMKRENFPFGPCGVCLHVTYRRSPSLRFLAEHQAAGC